MSYATITTLQNQWGAAEVTRSADRDASGVADTGAIDEALEGADGIINGKIGGLAVTIPAATLEVYAGWIAMYALSSDGPQGTMTEVKRERYLAAIAWLDAVAAGAVAPGEEPGTTTARSRVTAESREWTRTKIGGVL